MFTSVYIDMHRCIYVNVDIFICVLVTHAHAGAEKFDIFLSLSLSLSLSLTHTHRAADYVITLVTYENLLPADDAYDAYGAAAYAPCSLMMQQLTRLVGLLTHLLLIFTTTLYYRI
jgi:hypothetical protein